MAFGFGSSNNGFNPVSADAAAAGAANQQQQQANLPYGPSNDYVDPYWEQYQREKDAATTPEEKQAAYDRYIANRNADQDQRQVDYAEATKTKAQADNDAWAALGQFGGQGARPGYAVARSDVATGRGDVAAQRGSNAMVSSNVYADAGIAALGRQAPTLNVGQSNFYQSQGDQARSLQDQAARTLLSNAQAPEGPSAAEALVRQQSDQTMAQNLAMARSGRGAGANPAALRAAAFQNAQQQNQLGTSLGALRAQEFEAWRNRQLQGNVAGAQASSALASSTMSAQQQALELERLRTSLDQQQQQINAGLFKDASGIGLGYQQVAQGFDQTAQGYEGQAFDYNNAAGRQQLDAHALRTNQYNAGADRAERNTDKMVGAGAAILGSAITASDRRAKKNTRSYDDGFYGSDMRAKKDVREVDPRELDAAAGQADQIRGARATYPALETVREAPGYSFEYKEPERHGEGRFYGPMAQDLEQTPAGASTVRQAPDGTKMVDTGRLSLVNTAALHEQQSQLDAMDEELRKMQRVFSRPTAYPELR